MLGRLSAMPDQATPLQRAQLTFAELAGMPAVQLCQQRGRFQNALGVFHQKRRHFALEDLGERILPGPPFPARR